MDPPTVHAVTNPDSSASPSICPTCDISKGLEDKGQVWGDPDEDTAFLQINQASPFNVAELVSKLIDI
jgi:hypothetical protein